MDEAAALAIRQIIAERTGVDLAHATPAEEKIVRAITEYIGILREQGKAAAPRTLLQVRNRGLIGAAEAAVMKSKPTTGFENLARANLAELSYEQIIIDHPSEFSDRAMWFARRALGLPNSTERPPKKADHTAARNPPWSRDELILALDLYLRRRSAPPSKDSPEVAELSALLGKIQRATGGPEFDKFRNANGVYMKMMNFRRFDPEYTAEGRVGLTRGNKQEEEVWAEFSGDPAKLTQVVADIRTRADAAGSESPYWVFVCNPKRWAIDRFFDRMREHDTWGVRPSDRDRFAPGQLGIIRVGVDRRTLAERDGKPPLEPGIYALCEVESGSFPGVGANDDFWGEGQAREPGWPTVKIRYLRTYADKPLTIETLRVKLPEISPLVLNGFQAASFPIPAEDFRAVTALLGEDLEALPSPDAAVSSDKLSAIEQKYLRANIEVKHRLSRTIERGPVGAIAKKLRGFKCQVCEALGLPSLGFPKKNGEPYVEAHHVMPVSKLEVGSLAASNVMVLCANHHRQMHYADIAVAISDTTFKLTISGAVLTIPRLAIPTDGFAGSATNADLQAPAKAL